MYTHFLNIYLIKWIPGKKLPQVYAIYNNKDRCLSLSQMIFEGLLHTEVQDLNEIYFYI